MPVDYLAALSWLGLVLALGAAALPLVAALCPWLPDRGAGLALPAALATLAGVGYWVGQWQFGPLAAAAGVAVILAGSGVALARGVRVEWRRYLGVAAVFAVAYFLLLDIRAVDPGAVPGGGEKFLDFGLLASLLRAEALPPEDMWFAGESVRYYYGGHMLAALLAELTGTGASYAYNYALAVYYAAFVATAYGLAGSVASGAGRSYRAAGVFTAFFVGLASNLAPPIRLLSWALPGNAGERLLEVASLDRESLALGPGAFDYWPASRVVDGGQLQFINEFPFFAFLNGDLHGHMMSPPLLLLVAGLGYAYYRTPADAPAWQRAVPLLAAAPVVGLLLVVNTWSFPAGVGLVWLAVLFAPAPPWTLIPSRLRRGRSGGFRSETGTGGSAVGGSVTGGSAIVHEAARVVGAVLVAAAFGALAAAFVAPFVLGPASGRAIGLLPTPRADLPGLLVVHGAFLAVSVAYLVSRTDADRWLARPGPWGALAGLFAVTWLYRTTAVFLFGPPLLVAWWYLRRPAYRRDAGWADRAETDGGDSSRGLGYESVLLVGALGLLLVVEFAYVVEDAGPQRYNTVFKVYSQVWALWATVTGIALPAVVGGRGTATAAAADLRSLWGRLRRGTRDRVATDGSAGSRLGAITGALSGSRLVDRRHLRTVVAVMLVVLLVVSTSVYAGFGMAWKFDSGRDDPTLDARAFVADDHPGEYEAIEWLDDREGQPTIVEAPGTSIYQWVNGASSLTGLPTVAGWVHETGYRGAEVYDARVADVNQLFTGDATTRASLLREHDVRYVYVGPVERDRYSGADLSFGDEPGISMAHESGSVTVYAVDQSALGGSGTGAGT